MRAWTLALSEATALSRGGDAYIFHGTSLARAEAILCDGFRWHDGLTRDLSNLHVYWGPVEMAASFADKAAMGAGARPALLCARLSDVLASGEPLPMTSEDRQCEGEPELPDWRASLIESGALRVRGGCVVAGIRILGA